LAIPVEDEHGAIDKIRERAWQIALFEHQPALRRARIKGDPREIDVTRLDSQTAATVQRLKAELRQIVIRHAEFASKVSTAALIEEVNAGYLDHDWEHLNMAGPHEWIDASLLSSKYRTILKQYTPKMLTPLDDEIEVRDDAGRRITSSDFTRDSGNFTMLEVLGPVVSKLNHTGPNASQEDIELYKDLIKRAATQNRADMIAYLIADGHRPDKSITPRMDKTDVPVLLVNVPDQHTGEIKTLSLYIVPADSDMRAKWIENQLRIRYNPMMPQTVRSMDEVGRLLAESMSRPVLEMG
jgi:hypothetical protein